ncbi:MAG: riboflavin synthase [Planctomycetota bacterium]|nr:riboflavin synthase [Planctomycetota bacterium]
MFTGLVESMGAVVKLQEGPRAVRLELDAGALAAEVAVGDSVAVGGCCLTAVAVAGGRLAFDVVPETLGLTTLGERRAGDAVNLELPLKASARMGGHFVQGHVDAVAEVLAVGGDDGAVTLSIAVPPALKGQIVHKGSIAVDGVSLTVAGVDAVSFQVALVPHTLAVTTLGKLRRGDRVNLEGDVLAKYVAALLEARP